MTLLEVDEAANCISDQVDPEANIIFGAAFDPSLEGKIRVSVVATGMDGAAIAAIEPKGAQASNAQPLLVRDAARAAAAPEPVAEPVFARAAEPAPAAEPFLRWGSRESREEIASAAIEADPVSYAFDLEPELPMESVAEVEAPIVAEAEPAAAADDAPLFPDVRYGEEREKKGFFSMFGRPRYENPAPIRDYRGDPAPVLQARSTSSAKPVEEPEVEAAEQSDDLEIPSFLRRLAN